MRVEKRRFVTLDAMRGIAAFLVVLRHTGTTAGGWFPEYSYLAVDLFFILSGFVLAYAYDADFERGMGFSRFMKKRTLRLAPLYILGRQSVGSTSVLTPHTDRSHHQLSSRRFSTHLAYRT